MSNFKEYSPRELFAKYAANDVPGQELARGLQELQAEINRLASSGGFKKSRAKEKVQERAQALLNQHHAMRRQTGMEIEAEAMKKLGAAIKDEVRPEKQLAQIQAAQLRVAAMSDADLEAKAAALAGSKKMHEKAGVFRNVYECQASIAELSRRGKGEIVDLARESLKGFQEVLHGRPEIAAEFDLAHDYKQPPPQMDAIYVRDGNASLGFNFSDLVDDSILDRELAD